jgi:hypothetical protein
VLEALEFERERETVLAEQLEQTLTETEGARLDEAVFAGMTPEEVEIVRGLLEDPAEDEDEEIQVERDLFGSEPDPEAVEEEIARLERELADCRRRQQAFERYLSGLDRSEGQSPTAYAEG